MDLLHGFSPSFDLLTHFFSPFILSTSCVFHLIPLCSILLPFIPFYSSSLSFTFPCSLAKNLCEEKFSCTRISRKKFREPLPGAQNSINAACKMDATVRKKKKFNYHHYRFLLITNLKGHTYSQPDHSDQLF